MKIFFPCIVFCFLCNNIYCQNNQAEIKATKLYEGEKKSPAEVAIICKGIDYCPEGMNSIKFGGHFKTYIQDSLKTKVRIITIKNNKCVAVLPGKTDICLQVDMMAGVVMNGTTLTYKIICLTFQAEKGHRYTLDACTGINYGAWIVDETTSRIVEAEGNIPNEFFTANPSVMK